MCECWEVGGSISTGQEIEIHGNLAHYHMNKIPAAGKDRHSVQSC